MTSVICTYDTFENNLGINSQIGKKINESSLLVSDEYFSFRYFLKIDFVIETSQNIQNGVTFISDAHSLKWRAQL